MYTLIVFANVCQDHGLSVVPTKEWQDNLSKRLAFGPSPGTSTHLPDDQGLPASRRRRLNTNNNQPPTNWNSLYTIDPTPGMHLTSIINTQLTMFQKMTILKVPLKGWDSYPLMKIRR